MNERAVKEYLAQRMADFEKRWANEGERLRMLSEVRRAFDGVSLVLRMDRTWQQ